MATVQDLIDQRNGSEFGVTGHSYGDADFGQCTAVPHAWQGLLGLPIVYGNAVDIYDNAPDDQYVKTLNNPVNYPAPGDIVIWHQDPRIGTNRFGHVAVCISANPDTLTVLEQNDPVGVPARIHTFPNYAGVTGWIHPRVLDTPPPAPAPVPEPTPEPAPVPEPVAPQVDTITPPEPVTPVNSPILNEPPTGSILDNEPDYVATFRENKRFLTVHTSVLPIDVVNNEPLRDEQGNFILVEPGQGLDLAGDFTHDGINYSITVNAHDTLKKWIGINEAAFSPPVEPTPDSAHVLDLSQPPEPLTPAEIEARSVSALVHILAIIFGPIIRRFNFLKRKDK